MIHQHQHKLFLALLAGLTLLSVGCSSSQPYRPAYDPDLSAQEVMAHLLSSREHWCASQFGGSGTHIHDNGNGFGGTFVGVGETQSRLVERQLIWDEYGHDYLNQDPLMLVPMLRFRTPMGR